MDGIDAAPRQQYVAKNMEELCELLEKMSRETSASKLPGELRQFLYVLKTQRLRHRKDANAFCCAGGVLSLVRLLVSAATCEDRELTLLLGTLANVCSLDRSARTQVMNHGLEQLVKILQESSSDDVLNTAARCLANLGLDEANIATLQRHGLIQLLTHLLSRDDCSASRYKCKQSLLRCVRILCSQPECRDELKAVDGIHFVVECLTSHEEEVSVAALQLLEVLSQDTSDPDTLRPLCEVQAIQSVIRLCNHIKSSVKSSALLLLLYCTKSSDGRVALSSAGGVETLVAAMESTRNDPTMFTDVVRGACVCCREVVSRQRLRDCGGLQKIIKMLSQDEHKDLYHNIMAALVCYYFDENTLKVMVRQLGLLAVIKHHLELMTEAHRKEADNVTEQLEERLGENEEEKEDGEKMAEALSCNSDEESECSEIVNVHSITSSSSPCSTFPGTTSEKVSSSFLTKVSTQPSSTASADPMESESSLRFTRPQLEVVADRPSCLNEDSCETESNTLLPSSKRPRVQLDLDLSSPMPANFLDSLLSSPNPYQKESKASDSTFISEQNPPLASQIILMLSRISHLRDFLTYLSSPEMLPAIFSYFAAVKPPDFHVFKVLTRIFMNPHCFQDCITCLLPSKLYELLRVTDTASSELAMASPLPDLSPYQTASCYSFVSMCYSLLERLSQVAESPYGQGVLAHSLLRGEENNKQASCLSLPLLCRSARLCQRMMLGYGGFQHLCILARSCDDGDLQAMSLDSLLQLALTMIKPSSSRKRRRSYSTSDDLVDSSLPPSKAPRHSLSCVEPLSSEPLHLLSEPSQVPPAGRIAHCRYRDWDHCPFDMVITVSNEGSTPLSLQLHKSMLVDLSDVFAVMLGGQYMESSCSEVILHKVPPLAFLSLIHHAYGCGWQCPTVMETVEDSDWTHTPSDHKDDDNLQEGRDLSLISDLLISQVIDQCRGAGEKRLVRHCLQVLSCAGMFLLPELVTLCEHKAVNYLVPENVSAMFQFAELHWCLCLAESCVRCVVNLPHSQQRTDILRDIVESPQGETAIKIIRVFLEQSGDS